MFCSGILILLLASLVHFTRGERPSSIVSDAAVTRWSSYGAVSSRILPSFQRRQRYHHPFDSLRGGGDDDDGRSRPVEEDDENDTIPPPPPFPEEIISPEEEGVDYPEEERKDHPRDKEEHLLGQRSSSSLHEHDLRHDDANRDPLPEDAALPPFGEEEEDSEQQQQQQQPEQRKNEEEHVLEQLSVSSSLLEEENMIDDDDDSSSSSDFSNDAEDILEQEDDEAQPEKPPILQRKASRIIVDLMDENNEYPYPLESQALRRLILQRKEEQLQDYYYFEQEQHQKQQSHQKSFVKEQQHVLKRLLHSLAPKIPAIQASPDVTLRIVVSPQSDATSCGVAASLVATLAHVGEVMQFGQSTTTVREEKENHNGDTTTKASAPPKTHLPMDFLLQERRFQQLIECLQSGVNVNTNSGSREPQPQQSANVTHTNNGEEEEEETDVLQEWMEQHANVTVEETEHFVTRQGLSLCDCCRAAWGLAVLGAASSGNNHDTSTTTSSTATATTELLQALSWRARNLLLGRMQLLCLQDLTTMSSTTALSSEQSDSSGTSHEDQVSQVAEEIAHDAASALWAFACVKAILDGTATTTTSHPQQSTGSFTALFQVCCSILCQNPKELRNKVQKKAARAVEQTDLLQTNIGSNDVIEKLAQSEQEDIREEEEERRQEEGGESFESLEQDNDITIREDGQDSQIPPSDDIESLESAEEENQSPVSSVLVDRLSPQEVCDIVWALAAHGERSRADNPKHLTTATTAQILPGAAGGLLCEIAFDRVLDWLRQDVERLENFAYSPSNVEPKEEPLLGGDFMGEAHPPETEAENDGYISDKSRESHPDLSGAERDTFEGVQNDAYDEEGGFNPDSVYETAEETPEGTMVDAATLLAAERELNDGGTMVDGANLLSAERGGTMVDAANLLSAERELNDGGTMVDAAAILAAESVANAQQMDSTIDAPYQEESNFVEPDEDGRGMEQLDFSDGVESENSDLETENTADQILMEEPVNQVSRSLPALNFGAKELSALAWAVTELKDSLRHPIVQHIAKIIVGCGPESLSELSGNELTNLAYAVSKVVVENGDMNCDEFNIVLGWIAAEAFRDAPQQNGDEQDDPASWNDDVNGLLTRFQPSVLSRLILALASAASSSTNIVENDDATKRLAAVSLEVAVKQQEACSPEDLARIAFSYLELVYSFLPTHALPRAEANLGSVLSAVELALEDWEESPRQEEIHGPSTLRGGRRPNPFLSFFGRSWSYIANLEHHREEHNEEFLGAFPLPLMSRLPRLRDLPVDPSTLSKLTWSSSRLSRGQSAIDSFARVSLRLFSSRGGRLMRECHVDELASIARAADTVHSSQRELVNLFARRLLGVVNENPTLLQFSPPLHAVALLFSLGRLGVKYNPESDASSAHRRLQLVSKLPNLEEKDLVKLSSTVLLHLARALVLLDTIDFNSSILEATLGVLEKRMTLLDVSVRGLVETLGILVKMPNQNMGIRERSHSLLNEIATSLLCGQLEDTSSGDLRRIVHVYVTLPLDSVEPFIDAVEKEISRRKEQFLVEGQSPEKNTETLRQILEHADYIKHTLFKEDEQKESGFAALRGRLGSFFRAGKAEETNEPDLLSEGKDGDGANTEEEIDFVRQALAFMIFSTQDLLEKSQSQQLLTRITQSDAREDTSFMVELARCEALIAHYRNAIEDSKTKEDPMEEKDDSLQCANTKSLISRLLP